ncbi:hypothetical protein M407DRAFT_240947 [Tulasnella calospora MUT 4182]|uniref:Uncharacterized protein n=1 Tax=Tulasnella calospora MUT 4182 TaxID=1051891 RepID=A0A0C3LIP9_9AGAM|nr:hypothetical protein M407DRAFT_240947 [Tulasnella calospora MUT 4182]
MSRNIGRVNKREEALHNLELARRQRLLPVPCWEKQWVTPAGAGPGSTYKVMKWVKTDKKQDFSDDELAADADETQAPLRDEMEALAGAADKEVEEQEAMDRAREEGDSRAGSEEAPEKPRKLGQTLEVGTGDVTPAETDRSPMPPSPMPPSPVAKNPSDAMEE